MAALRDGDHMSAAPNPSRSSVRVITVLVECGVRSPIDARARLRMARPAAMGTLGPKRSSSMPAIGDTAKRTMAWGRSMKPIFTASNPFTDAR